MIIFSILGRYDNGLDEEKWIQYHFVRWLWKRGLAVNPEGLDVRPPVLHEPDWSIADWHQDGNRTDLVFWMVLWSSIRPTELRLKDSKRVISSIHDGDVILFRNDLFEHRIPPGGMIDRWFIRASDVRQINQDRSVL